MGEYVRIIIACAAIVQAATAGAWTLSEEKDDFTGKTISRQETKSQNSLRLGFPYKGKNHGYITYSQHSTGFQSVMLIVDKGQFMREVDYCAVAVKFGDNEPRNFVMRQSSDGDNSVLFFSYAEGIIEELKTHKNFKVRAGMYREGLQTLNFINKAPLLPSTP